MEGFIMKQTNLLKNAVLRNKVETKVTNPAGDIAAEIAEQDLNVQAGGTTIVTTVVATVVATNQVATQLYKCGKVLTVSAECTSNKKPC